MIFFHKTVSINIVHSTSGCIDTMVYVLEFMQLSSSKWHMIHCISH